MFDLPDDEDQDKDKDSDEGEDEGEELEREMGDGGEEIVDEKVGCAAPEKNIMFFVFCFF